MRAIVIDPAARAIYETTLPMSSTFMDDMAKFIGADVLGLDVSPPLTAMFLDAFGFLREEQAFWRLIGGRPENNVAGVGVMFGLAPDGKLADLPADITTANLAEKIEWVGDKVVNTVERMEIVQFPGGPAPRVHRTTVWEPGKVYPASVPVNPVRAPVAGDAYADATTQDAINRERSAQVAAVAAMPVIAGVPMPPVWAIHETADNRYRVIEYEVTDAGLGSPLSLSTVPNLDEARKRIPAGLTQITADEDATDDTLVETWA